MREARADLNIIRFESEMLSNWAQLLDLAARLYERLAPRVTCIDRAEEDEVF